MGLGTSICANCEQSSGALPTHTYPKDGRLINPQGDGQYNGDLPPLSLLFRPSADHKHRLIYSPKPKPADSIAAGDTSDMGSGRPRSDRFGGMFVNKVPLTSIRSMHEFNSFEKDTSVNMEGSEHEKLRLGDWPLEVSSAPVLGFDSVDYDSDQQSVLTAISPSKDRQRDKHRHRAPMLLQLPLQRSTLSTPFMSALPGPHRMLPTLPPIAVTREPIVSPPTLAAANSPVLLADESRMPLDHHCSPQFLLEKQSLRAALDQDDVENVQKLLSANPQLNILDLTWEESFGDSALHLAVRAESMKTIRFLLSLQPGGGVMQVNEKGESSIVIAGKLRAYEILALLMQALSQPYAYSPQTPLRDSLCSGQSSSSSSDIERSVISHSKRGQREQRDSDWADAADAWADSAHWSALDSSSGVPKGLLAIDHVHHFPESDDNMNIVKDCEEADRQQRLTMDAVEAMNASDYHRHHGRNTFDSLVGNHSHGSDHSRISRNQLIIHVSDSDRHENGDGDSEADNCEHEDEGCGGDEDELYDHEVMSSLSSEDFLSPLMPTVATLLPTNEFSIHSHVAPIEEEVAGESKGDNVDGTYDTQPSALTSITTANSCPSLVTLPMQEQQPTSSALDLGDRSPDQNVSLGQESIPLAGAIPLAVAEDLLHAPKTSAELTESLVDDTNCNDAVNVHPEERFFLGDHDSDILASFNLPRTTAPSSPLPICPQSPIRHSSSSTSPTVLRTFIGEINAPGAPPLTSSNAASTTIPGVGHATTEPTTIVSETEMASRVVTMEMRRSLSLLQPPNSLDSRYSDYGFYCDFLEHEFDVMGTDFSREHVDHSQQKVTREKTNDKRACKEEEAEKKRGRVSSLRSIFSTKKYHLKGPSNAASLSAEATVDVDLVMGVERNQAPSNAADGGDAHQLHLEPNHASEAPTSSLFEIQRRVVPRRWRKAASRMLRFVTNHTTGTSIPRHHNDTQSRSPTPTMNRNTYGDVGTTVASSGVGQHPSGIVDEEGQQLMVLLAREQKDKEMVETKGEEGGKEDTKEDRMEPDTLMEDRRDFHKDSNLISM